MNRCFLRPPLHPFFILCCLCCFQETATAQINTTHTSNPTIDSLIRVSQSFTEKLEFGKALAINKTAEQLAGQQFGTSSAEYASTSFNRGRINYIAGNLKEAYNGYHAARSIYATIFGKNHERYGSCIAGLANVALTEAQYEEAEALLKESLRIWDSNFGINHPLSIGATNNLSSVYRSQGRYLEAEALLKSCLTRTENFIGKNNPEYAGYLTNLGIVYYFKGEFQEAGRLYMESKEIFENSLGKFHPQVAKSLNNLGLAYQQLDRLSEAEAAYTACNKLIATTLGTAHPDYANGLNNLAELHIAQGRYPQAEKVVSECLKVLAAAKDTTHPDYAAAQNNFAQICYLQGRYAEAAKLKTAAIATTFNLITKAVIYSSEKDLGDFLKQEAQKLTEIQQWLHTGKLAPDFAGLAYDNALFQKGFLQNAARRLNITPQMGLTADSLYQQLKRCLNVLSYEYTKPKVERFNVTQWEQEAIAIERALSREIRGFDELIKPVKWQTVQGALKQGEAAIEFIHFPAAQKSDTVIYAALVLTPEAKQPTYVFLCSEKALTPLFRSGDSRKEDYVNHLYGAENHTLHSGIAPDSSRLYDLIWKPLEPHLKGVKTIYYAPAGLLHRINIGAILSGDEILFDRYQLNLLGSTRSHLQAVQPKPTNTQALLLGDITYTVDPNALPSRFSAPDTTALASRGAVLFRRDSTEIGMEVWEPLLYAGKEVRKIRQIMKNAGLKPLLISRADASEAAFKEIANRKGHSPRVIHLATHGYFLSELGDTEKFAGRTTFSGYEHPMIRSGLILAGGNFAWNHGRPQVPGGEDGILTAYEISQLNLSNTELAVLSACETGLGDIKDNEGVYGLQRAFHIAGVQYVIMSLWDIPDRSTEMFMSRFYEYWLQEQRSIPEAFAATRSEMRRKGMLHHQWAGFVLRE
jgi:CHAT domain-containing protein